jgi:hypothetical protein
MQYCTPLRPLVVLNFRLLGKIADSRDRAQRQILEHYQKIEPRLSGSKVPESGPLQNSERWIFTQIEDQNFSLFLWIIWCVILTFPEDFRAARWVTARQI